jgi:monoamine oxidase
MAKSDFEVVVVGAGAAGIAAARRLHDSGVDCLLVEARDRIGGRSWTVEVGGYPIDIGCGWLHSADRNPWTGIAEAQGRTIDRTPPPWVRPAMPIGFPLEDQAEFRDALFEFFDKQTSRPTDAPDVASGTLLPPGGRWNALIGAVSTFLSGAEPDRLSARDFARYDDSGVNWRMVEGYGTTIAAHAAGVPLRVGCVASLIDHSGKRVAIETSLGALVADAVIVTLPSSLIALESIAFTPGLPGKVDAASGLPLGLADKLFLSLSGAEEFEKESRLFANTASTATGAYHFRPFGRPQIEAYFGGEHAAALEAGGKAAFFDFALEELTRLLGSGIAQRIQPLALHRWSADPFARGSYSYASPGKADGRSTLAAPVDDRLFFAGEACSVHDFSTAHGAFLTGIAAAENMLRARTR